MPVFEGSYVEFVSTRDGLGQMVEGYKFHYFPDFNRQKIFSIFKSFSTVYKIIREMKPDVVITTGSAPGMLALLAARIQGVRTIWIDSIANVERLSLSGRIASRIAHRAYTQWPHLAKGKIIYSGNVIG
nr:glycosyltransferase [Flavihumibacter rivuli]